MNVSRLSIAVTLALGALCQEPKPAPSRGAKLAETIRDYLNMAEGGKTATFQPLTQRERNRLFGESLINPIWYLRGATSAAQNQWTDSPKEWEQGASGYGKRFGDIMGQYAIRKTVTFGFESLLHEDNQYFPSGKKGFWPRTGYALSSGLLARHDNGKRYPSASLLVGVASGAYFSRFWQPPGSRSVGDAAVSFGISMGWNIGFSVVKEFLPDMVRPILQNAKSRMSRKTGIRESHLPAPSLCGPVYVAAINADRRTDCGRVSTEDLARRTAVDREPRSRDRGV